MKEALFWRSVEDGVVECGLCHHRCVIEEGQRGVCRVRENRGGRLMSLGYGRAVGCAVDPIEKKPLYHFLPGSRAFSFGVRGCNMRCMYCQNSHIAHVAEGDRLPDDPETSPEQIVREAQMAGCRSIAYTYTEPTVFYEYAYDVARLAAQQSIKNVFVTNGYITPEAFEKIAPMLDAANVDLKFYDDALYRRICGAGLRPVLDMIRLYHEAGWVEVTTLLVPGYNDDHEQLEGIAGFIASVDRDIPWHISAFYPTYKLTEAPPTPLSALLKARDIGRQAGLNYIYLGNVRGRLDTVCPDCGEVLISRSGYRLEANRVQAGKCLGCGKTVAGVWA